MDKMSCISYRNEKPKEIDQIINLYKAVGWTRYTNEPDKLIEAINNSTYVIFSYDQQELIGLVRGVSDGVSIHFIQDFLVHPKYQKCGVGRTLLKKALALYPNVYKEVLLTDDETYQKKFYEDMGFKNIILLDPKINAYIKLVE